MVFVPMHFVWCMVFVNYLSYGFIGTAYAITATSVLNLLTILLVIHFQKGQDVIESWVPFTNEIFLDLKPFISMSIAGVMIYCGDEWCSEGVTMIAGFLGVKNQAAIYIQHSICLLMGYLP